MFNGLLKHHFRFFKITYTTCLKKSGTGHFCHEKHMNQHIAMKFEIHTIQPIIQVMYQSYYPTLKITNASDLKKNDTGHFCDKKQTNQRIDVKFGIHTIQPIIQVV